MDGWMMDTLLAIHDRSYRRHICIGLFGHDCICFLRYEHHHELLVPSIMHSHVHTYMQEGIAFAYPLHLLLLDNEFSLIRPLYAPRIYTTKKIHELTST